ncbi:hypothetical protein D3C73_1352420 [compost metagenome]
MKPPAKAYRIEDGGAVQHVFADFPRNLDVLFCSQIGNQVVELKHKADFAAAVIA